jgi:hypothetical protein
MDMESGPRAELEGCDLEKSLILPLQTQKLMKNSSTTIQLFMKPLTSHNPHHLLLLWLQVMLNSKHQHPPWAVITVALKPFNPLSL